MPASHKLQPVSDGLLTPDRLDAACQILRALMHPVRLRLCELLLRGDCTVGDLATALDLKPNVVSQHLNLLRAFGIVTPRRLGRTVHYVVTHPGPGWLLECIRRHGPGADAAARE